MTIEKTTLLTNKLSDHVAYLANLKGTPIYSWEISKRAYLAFKEYIVDNGYDNNIQNIIENIPFKMGVRGPLFTVITDKDLHTTKLTDNYAYYEDFAFIDLYIEKSLDIDYFTIVELLLTEQVYQDNKDILMRNRIGHCKDTILYKFSDICKPLDKNMVDKILKNN